MTATTSAVAGLTVCVALWGAVFVGTHELLATLDPLQIATWRYLVVGVIFAAAIVARPSLRPQASGREYAVLALAGLAAVPGSQLPLIEGQRYVSPPLASLIMTLAPAFAAAMAFGLGLERLRRMQVAGLIIALIGVAGMLHLGSGSGADRGATSVLGALLTLISPLCWAIYTLLSKPLVNRHSATTAVSAAMVIGSLSLAPFMPHTLSAAGELTTADWAWVLFLGVGGTAAPYLLWSLSLRVLPVSRATAFMYLTPLFALAWTALFLGATPATASLLAGVVVILGVCMAQASGAARSTPPIGAARSQPPRSKT